MTDPSEEDVALKLLHTADWHLGQRFMNFEKQEHQERLSRERLSVVKRVLDLARSEQVHAVLCAGDLFHDPHPEDRYWKGLLKHLQEHDWTDRPVFLLPGNHDPLLPTSPYSTDHPFRQGLPANVHVVDKANFTYPLKDDAVLYASPCFNTAGDSDQAMGLPEREPGDERFRIGMVHGSTHDIANHQANFPISIDAPKARGLDYLAIGDTHGFRILPEETAVQPVVYPSSPEPTSFKEIDPGYAALVFFRRRGRAPRISKRPTAFFKWETVRCTSMAELRDLTRRNLSQTVLRLSFDMDVSVPEFDEAQELIEQLRGTDAQVGLAGALKVDVSGLRQNPLGEWPEDLPPTIQATVDRLRGLAIEGDDEERPLATRALVHLYRLVRTQA